MRISDWSSDVCSSDLPPPSRSRQWMGRSTCDGTAYRHRVPSGGAVAVRSNHLGKYPAPDRIAFHGPGGCCGLGSGNGAGGPSRYRRRLRSEEHTSELQSLMRISYDVFCLKKKKNT